MTTKPSAALVYGAMAHHLDHLVPICELLGIPLIVTKEPLLTSSKKYYPFIDTQLWSYDEIAERLVHSFEVIFCSFPRLMFEEIFFFAQHLMQKRVHTIWCPHGNSDKGHHSYFMKALENEEVSLIYGKKMIDFLVQKNAFHQLKAAIQVGNMRLAHYLKHKEHYTTLLKNEITSKLPESVRTILYAPTWQDTEKNTSFFDAVPHLVEKLPDQYNLIIKLHPNLSTQEEIKLDLLIEKHQDKPNILFVKEFYPIYPLLDFVDLYLGDMSSIGYDFLSLSKPLFFLNQQRRDPATDPALYLARCGTVISPEEYPSIYNIIESSLTQDTEKFAAIRKEVYEYTFGKLRNETKLKKEILNTFNLFLDSDMPL